VCRFDESVRRALKHERPSSGGGASKKRLKAFADYKQGENGVLVLPIAANLGTGKLEAIPQETSVVDALMCACARVPFFRAQSIEKDGAFATFIDGISVSKDPIVPVWEEAYRMLALKSDSSCDCLRIISVPLLPLEQENLPRKSDLHRTDRRCVTLAPAPAFSRHAPRQEYDRSRQSGAWRQARDHF
jgi:predicted acylesterase/phospholipase RssA